MDLHVEQRGRADAEPLLLIMGMSGTRLHWGERFLAALERDFRVVAIDNRGAGDSPRIDPEAPFSIADLAEDTARVLDRAELESAHVLGISMGGMVAQELALAHPARLRTLTLGCTFAGGPTAVPAPPETMRTLGAALRSGDRAAAVRAGWELNVSARVADDPDEWALFQEVAAAGAVAVPVIRAQLRAVTAHDTLDRLDRVRAPTLVVHGDEDRMLPVGNAGLMAERIPEARLEVLEGVGHMFWWEQPDRSARLVAEHALGGVPAG